MSKTMRWLPWFALVLMLATSGVCLGQIGEVSLSAEISRQRAYIGTVLTYQVTVRGVDANIPPTIAFPATVRAVPLGGGRQSFVSTLTINGKTRSVTNEGYTYRYSVMFLEPGQITIGPASITVGSQSYESNTVTVEALYPALAIEDKIEVDIQRTKLYINESVPVDIVWWIGNNNTADFTFDSSIFPSSFTVTPVQPGVRGAKQYEIDIAGQQTIGVLDESIRDGVGQIRMRMRIMITPTQPGEYTLGPFRVIFNRAESSTRRYRAYVESKQFEIVVVPVPDEGKPPGYSGAIGNYSLAASASNQSVNIGDPIELTLRVSGNEPMHGIASGPDLAAIPAFANGFRLSSEGWREDFPRQESVRIFRTTIRALSDAVTEIPAVQLPAFDPESERYRIFYSNSIPIEVRAVREVTIADAVGSFGTPTNTPQKTQNTIQSSGSEMWAHASASSMLKRDGFDLVQMVRSPMWIGAMAVGPMSAMIVLLSVRRRRFQSVDSGVLRKAWSTAKRLGSQGQSGEAIRVYLGAVVGCDRRAFSSADLVSLDLDQSLHDEVEGILRSEEQAAFAVEADQTPPSCPSDLLRRLRRAIEQSNIRRAS